jgi:hypothetical protein
MVIKTFETFGRNGVEEITRQEFLETKYVDSVFINDEITYAILKVLNTFDWMFEYINQTDQVGHVNDGNTDYSIIYTNFDGSDIPEGQEIVVWMNSDYEMFLLTCISGERSYYRVDIGFGVDGLCSLINDIMSTYFGLE